ncbi:TPA: hypothetical protein ACTD5V_000722 [Legionella pneumophila]
MSSPPDVIKNENNDFEIVSPRPYGLIEDLCKVKYKNRACMYPGCNQPTINSHTLSKASIRKYANNQIINLKTINHDLFENIKPTVNRKYYKPCDLNKISTFNGFCSEHDNSIFYELDNYDGNITPQIALLGHYRIICYGLNTIRLQLKQNEFLRGAKFVGAATKKINEIYRKIKNGFYEHRLKMAETDYVRRKMICEDILAIGTTHDIKFVTLQGTMSDPLFFGRAGIFLHQFGKGRLPLRFMLQMPYISYFSICDGKTCKLIFVYLAQDSNEYERDLENFLNHVDLKKRLEILIYPHSDCCILRNDIPQTSDNTIKQLINFYR